MNSRDTPLLYYEHHYDLLDDEGKSEMRTSQFFSRRCYIAAIWNSIGVALLILYISISEGEKSEWFRSHYPLALSVAISPLLVLLFLYRMRQHSILWGILFFITCTAVEIYVVVAPAVFYNEIDAGHRNFQFFVINLVLSLTMMTLRRGVSPYTTSRHTILRYELDGLGICFLGIVLATCVPVFVCSLIPGSTSVEVILFISHAHLICGVEPWSDAIRLYVDLALDGAVADADAQKFSGGFDGKHESAEGDF